MRSKIATRPAPIPQSPPITKTVQPARVVDPTASSAAARFSDTFKKRRLGIWAVGVAIIVGAGAITGGEIRERQKAKERITAQATGQYGVLEDTSETVNTVSQNKTIDARATALPTKQPQDQAVLGTAQHVPVSASKSADATGRGMSYDQRQITYLEDRRAVLIRQRLDVEKKLERVREKKKREEEVEGRRGAAIRGVER